RYVNLELQFEIVRIFQEWELNPSIIQILRINSKRVEIFVFWFKVYHISRRGNTHRVASVILLIPVVPYPIYANNKRLILYSPGGNQTFPMIRTTIWPIRYVY